MNLFRRKQLSPEVLAINPGGTVPVLDLDDGTYLSESPAICWYLDAMFPEPALLGTTPSQQALTLMWASIVDNEGMSAIAEVFRNLSSGFQDHALPGPLAWPRFRHSSSGAGSEASSFSIALASNWSISPGSPVRTIPMPISACW